MGKPLFWLHGNPVTPIELLFAVAALVLVALALIRARRAADKLIMEAGESPTARAALRGIWTWPLLAVGILLVLDSLNLHLPSAALFAGLLSIAAAAALQPLLAAIAGGLLLRMERPFSVGDRVTVGKIEGDVKAISLRSIVVRTPDNALIAIPNSYLAVTPVVNWSAGDRKLRVRVPVFVAHGSDLKRTTMVLQRAAESSSRVVKSPPPRVLLTGGGKAEHRFEIWAWISGPGDRSWAKNELYRAIDGELRKANIRLANTTRRGSDIHAPDVGAAPSDTNHRDARAPRERRRRSGGDRRFVSAPDQPTVRARQPSEPAPEAAASENTRPITENEPEEQLEPAGQPSDSDSEEAKAGESREESAQAYGRSKRRLPRR